MLTVHVILAPITRVILIIEAITEQSQLMMLYLLNDLGEKFHNNQF